MATRTSSFVWYELATTDLDAAEAFYGAVVGWRMTDAGMPGFRYSIAHAGEAPVGGMMTMPPEACSAGAKPGWVGYVGVPDVDAAADDLARAGGKVLRAPDDIPGVGRFAIVADPQGAAFDLFTPRGEPMPRARPGTPGAPGWHELHTSDSAAAFGFYSGLFGWEKSMAVDMGPMGVYQVFKGDGADIGGMMTNAKAPAPHWLYYFTVEEIDAAAARVRDAGGTITNGPHVVPGGMWILHVTDPQGIAVALVGPRAGA